MKKVRLLIDTDIGDEIDDAFAIYFAMRQNVEIVGVTTVFKNTYLRAQMVKRLLSEFGNGYEKVPVYAGYGNAEGTKITQTPCLYTDADKAFAIESENQDDAIDFIIQCCEKYGNELTVVAIGPFTNIAKAIQKKPNVFNQVNLVIMGGAYFSQYADWNVSCDVESAKIMFDNAPTLNCLGADVTHLMSISDENKAKILGYKNNGKNRAGRYVSQLYERYNDLGKTAYLHDPLAIYFAINNDVCVMEKARIEVITDGFARGITLNVDEYSKEYLNPYYLGYAKKREVSVAKQVKKKEFIDLFTRVFEEE